MKNKCLLILISLTIISLIVLYQQSYAKYLKNINGNVDIKVARWNILINDEDITNKKTLTNVISAYFPKTEFYNEGVIAPGAEGYFDIVLDPKNVDVSFKYLITSDNNISIFPDLKIIKYEVDTAGKGPFLSYENSGITGIINPSDKAKTIRIYVKWDDSSSNIMDNSMDTSFSNNNSEVQFLVSVNLTQIKN